MSSSRKLTKREEVLRQELVELEERINRKIRRIGLTHQKLPYERLAKGRRLKELVLLAIGFLEEGRKVDLDLCLRELMKLGIEIKKPT